MLIAIDYGNGDVEEFDSASRQTDYLKPVGHAQRVMEVSSIIGAAMKRRAFFKGLTALRSDELLDPEHSYHQEYRGHLRDLAAIPYDGYHTDYSRWALEYDNQQHDKELSSADFSSLRSLGSLDSSSAFNLSTYLADTPAYLSGTSTSPSLDAKKAQSSSNELLSLPFIKELDQADAVGRIDEADGVDANDRDGSRQAKLPGAKPHRDDKSFDT
ncbi:hypothetical protein [Pseudomonas sp. WCS374]|uniref:hypothetical protein n=1 Tax=Pseudomonas sp. WCS374 TaxID=1495331 RepID=UPI00049A7E60|nr:hypothetical protein [Pseudomonas sp. WCS374]AIB42919.1 hypothetical protein PD374_17955 [Pseudomonas sp. WCS374]